MDIVEELRSDREKGARRLEAEYKAGLMSLALRFCNDPGDAEELVNSTFATVVENIDNYIEQSAFFAWMCQILTSKVSRNTRRKSRQMEVFPGVLPEAVDENGGDDIYRKLDATLLRDAIDTLPPDIRKTLLMHYFMDFSVKDVARMLAIPAGTVMWRLHYARQILAAKLGAAAKKPGAKVLLVAFSLAALTAAGAASSLAVVRLLSPATPAPEQQAYNNKDAAAPEQQAYDSKGSAAQNRTGGTEGTEGTGETSAADAASVPPAAPVPPVLSFFGTDSSITQTPQQEQTMNTTTRSMALGAAATALALASTAEANLPPLDSAQFDYKYEMVARPDQQDLDGGGANDFTGWSTAFSLGTGADVGTIKIDASSNGKYLVSNQAVGTAGDGWRSMAASSSTGFTVETRLKITDCTGANGAICIEAGPSDSKVYARLNFFDSSIGWNGTTLTNLDTSAWHTYRIAREGGTATHSVWVDGVLVAENLGTGFTYNTSTLYRMLLGSPGSGWTGKAQVAWLRFHKGAYAPLPPDYRPPRKASTDFPVQYEMASSDARISTTGNASDWTLSGQTGATISKNGVLSVVPNGKQTYWRTTDSVWKDHVTADTAFTFDCEVQIKSCTITGGDRTLQIWIASPRATGNLIIGTNHVYWQLTSSMGDNILLDASDNTDGKHAFRIAYDGATRHGFTVWRDGVKLGENLVDLTAYNGASYSFVRFGIPGSTSGGAFDIGYIRWDTTGAYDWKDPPKAFTVVIR